MNDVQKVIKYFAIAFAVMLTFGIVTSIVGSISFVGRIFDYKSSSVTESFKETEINDGTNALYIDVDGIDVEFRESDSLSAESNSEDITIKQNGNKMIITEKNHNWFNSNSGDLIINVPRDMIFDNVEMNLGAGKVVIDRLVTKKLDLELGAGKVDINYLEATDKTSIEGGAGSFNIKDGKLYNIDFEMGVGSVNITSAINGKGRLEAGIGSINLNIIGNRDDYKIYAEKGIGSIKVDGTELANESTFGYGDNSINIEGGIGGINVSFSN